MTGTLLSSEFGTREGVLVGVVVVLILAIAVLAWAETAISRMTRARAAAMVDQEHAKADRLLHLASAPESFVNALLLLILMLQLTEATLVGILAAQLFGPVGLVVATVVNIAVVFVVAEAAPKSLALEEPDRSALRAAPLVELVAHFPPLRWLSTLLIGVTNVVLPGKGRRAGPYLSDEEIVHFATQALEDEVIDEDERDMIESVLELGDTLVREVMVPRPEMVTVAADVPLEEAVDLALRRGVSRLPVHRGDVDEIDEVLNLKDAVRRVREGRGDEPVGEATSTAMVVPELISASRALRQMQDLRTHLALVVDERGGLAGLVTLEDLIEELVGEIVDETDRTQQLCQLRDDGSVLVRGSLSIDDANEHLEDLLAGHPADVLPEGDWESVGGLILEHLGRPAGTGNEVSAAGHRLTVHEMRGRRIMWVLVEPGAAGDEVPETSEPDAAVDAERNREDGDDA
ncbi:MAG: hemolysin family protein [Microthrixaceae bacterium]